MIQGVAFAIALLISAVVAADASRLGARRGRLGGGFLDMGPVAWFFVCLLGGVISLIVYLCTRPRLKAMRYSSPPPPLVPYAGEWQRPGRYGAYAAPQPPAPPATGAQPWSPAPAAPVSAPGQVSAERFHQLVDTSDSWRRDRDQ